VSVEGGDDNKKSDNLSPEGWRGARKQRLC
jgi:hypothetical protein